MRPTAVAHSHPCLSLNQKTRCILPCGHGRSPSGEVGTPARRASLRLPGGGFDFAALRVRRFALRRSLGRLRGVGFCLCGTHSASPSWDYSLIFSALRALRFAPWRSWGRLRGARQGGAGYGASPVNLMPNSALRVWAAIGGIAAGRKGTDISR